IPPLEIVGTETQGNTSPVVGTASQHAGAEPVESGTLGTGIRFALDLPSSECRIEIAECALGVGSAARRLPGRAQLGPVFVFGGIVVGTGFKNGHRETGFGKDFGSHTAAGAGPDNNHIV